MRAECRERADREGEIERSRRGERGGGRDERLGRERDRLREKEREKERREREVKER